MKARGGMLLFFVSLAAIAGACVYARAQVPATISVSAWQSLSGERTWRAVAEEVEKFGDLFKDVEGPVSVYIKYPHLPQAILTEMGPKTCGETLKDRANRTADAAALASTGGGGGGIDGGGEFGGVGDDPWGNCFSQPGGGGCVSVGGGEYHCEARTTELVCPGA
ncbi:hypothetical protein [Lysobacter sp. Root983]|uniref:hypothetical protein n=1 Tax=Lysobacter sp. Root983 TaxID=1736613 RepID=UPI0012FA519A|nr:hypothetical protein [Lysobacter sp. Root983]